jgi:hypothetical protein
MVRWVYLMLALAGGVLSLLFYRDNGFVPLELLGLKHMLLGPVTMTIWILAEVYVRKDYWVAPIAIAVTFALGLPCGLPLYLYLRTRPIQ